MLHFAPYSTFSILALIICFALVCVFEFVNGFHDTANAVATVIYTKSLKPRTAVIWSGLMNFVGVVLGGISVAYGLVELLPADVLSPPNGDPAVPMLIALFGTALAWNLFTWWFGIPNSSSHCVIGALIGIAIGDALLHTRAIGNSVDWSQIWKILRALAISPLLGLIGAGGLYFIIKHLVHDPELYQPPQGDKPTRGWVRGLLILTCTGVSFSHGSNDGQKSIGLIMLTIIGILPATFALAPNSKPQISHIAQYATDAVPLITQYDHDGLREEAIASVNRLAQTTPDAVVPSQLRADLYEVVAGLKAVSLNTQASAHDRASAKTLSNQMRPVVEYAPWWVRLLSALCLGIGTMIGYKRIVHTLGEKIGNTHLTPAQGASAELVGAGLIATAGYTGLPVSTTHIITAGIAGTMLGSGSGINRGMLVKIALAWVFTLPVTITIAASLFYVLSW
ncbi:inorganic phosphate transporter [Komagataeibacter xylinus]|uniref:Phosphate transporter n=1 Tax=Komagataeibacter xylinus TaxID=28448 RepID=A0A318PX17_KOMXY|nr:inorganic phosphate transporter [Komagataeibacter xylinus]AZV37681.1 inorganic phosphate transporter [Komagataeibacter xylinus]PYD58269.1 inorganic phosphate transporter [Komagataeibacter xylinus]GBQ78849.1 inorganic phosphate transporter [Komagataeibacter xylinus NBRC 15237]